MNHEFVPVALSGLTAGEPHAFDLHIQIGQRFLLLSKKGDALEDDRLKKFREKNVNSLWVPSSQMDALFKYRSGILRALQKSQEPKLVRNSMGTAAHTVFLFPQEKVHFNFLEDLVDVQVSQFMKDPHLIDEIFKGQVLDDLIINHCTNVSVLAMGLGAALGASSEMCQVMGLGALLHDIGDDRPRERLLQREEFLSHDERAKYHGHPRMGAAQLKGKSHIPADVLDVILLHHERLDGAGFPAGIQRIDQIFQVVGLANFFDREVTFFGVSPTDALEKLRAMDPLPYEEELVDGLEEIVRRILK